MLLYARAREIARMHLESVGVVPPLDAPLQGRDSTRGGCERCAGDAGDAPVSLSRTGEFPMEACERSDRGMDAGIAGARFSIPVWACTPDPVASGGENVSDADAAGWVGASWAPGCKIAANRGLANADFDIARFDEKSAGFWYVSFDGREEAYAYQHYFYKRRFGFFIELGANDGIKQSNTLRLEELLGWRGLHIEGDRSTHARLRKNRPNQLAVQAVVCRAGGEVTWLTGSQPLTNGIASLMPNEMLGQYHSDFDPSDLGTDSEEHSLPVKCSPLSSILASLGRTTVDLWVLDVEGAELEVLESLDFSAVTVNVVCTEALNFEEPTWAERHRKVREKLLASGFRYDGYDREMMWFVGEGFTPSANPALQ